MKNSMLLLFTIIVSFSFMQSCTESSVLDTNDDLFFVAMVDGTPYEVEGNYNAYAADFTNNTNVYGVLDFNANSNQSMYIQMPLNPTVGTQTFDEDTFAYYFIGDDTWSTKRGNGNGTITIDQYDGVNMSGTFSFTAYNFEDDTDGVEVTNGKFNVIKR